MSTAMAAPVSESYQGPYNPVRNIKIKNCNLEDMVTSKGNNVPVIINQSIDIFIENLDVNGPNLVDTEATLKEGALVDGAGHRALMAAVKLTGCTNSTIQGLTIKDSCINPSISLNTKVQGMDSNKPTCPFSSKWLPPRYFIIKCFISILSICTTIQE